MERPCPYCVSWRWFLVVVLGLGPALCAQVLVPRGSSWRYDDTGIDLGETFRTAGFDDSLWPSGPAPLGYGEGDEATVLSFGPDSADKHPACYFRRTFEVPEPGTSGGLVLRLVRDDGCIVYLNGIEVARSNMPPGPVTFETFAEEPVSGAAERSFLELALAGSALEPGENVLAVELHQSGPASSDLRFDLELEALAPSGPEVILASPPDGTMVNGTRVSFSFAASDDAGLVEAAFLLGPAPEELRFADCVVAQLSAAEPDRALGSPAAVTVDGRDPHAHALLRFPALAGSGRGRVPPGGVVLAASLELYCSDPGAPVRLHRLLEEWSAAEATWNERGAGALWSAPGADGPGSRALEALEVDCRAVGWKTIDVTPLVRDWARGAPNHGVVLVDSGTDGADFDGPGGASPPRLTVRCAARDLEPAASQLLWGTSGTFRFELDLDDGLAYSWNCLVTNARGGEGRAARDFRLAVDSAAPDAPVRIAPPEEAEAAPESVLLEVAASDPQGELLDVEIYGRRAGGAEEFTIIALPDTQFYSESYPEIFTAQTRWVADNVAALNIVFVTHEGDLVQHWDSVTEWERALDSMSLLDGVVPYGMAPGNHDQPTNYYNQYFPYRRYENEPWYGGHHGDTNDNNYQLFSAGGLDFLCLHLEFCPPPEVLAWADGILKSFPGRRAIITTHGFLGADGSRSVHRCGDTQFLWDSLIAPHPNVGFVLCGHVHAEFARTDTAGGRQVHQLLADYQSRPNGGEGWLRILRFVPPEDRVYVTTYSPWLDRSERDADSQFTLSFPMNEFALLGRESGVPSGSTVTAPWRELESGRSYEWFAAVTDPEGRRVEGPRWRFRTEARDVEPPVISALEVAGVTATSATLLWETHEPADSMVEYGLDLSYGAQVLAPALVTRHAVRLEGLIPETAYHVRVASRDRWGNEVRSPEWTFTTRARYAGTVRLAVRPWAGGPALRPMRQPRLASLERALEGVVEMPAPERE